MNSAIARKWIWKADRDFLLASQVSQTFSDIAAFHYQQAAEKYLKAYLSFHRVGLKKTHNIGTLALMASQIDPAFSQLASVADVDAITEFATVFRYPNEEEVDFPDEAELQSAREFCVVAKQMVTDRISSHTS